MNTIPLVIKKLYHPKKEIHSTINLTFKDDFC